MKWKWPRDWNWDWWGDVALFVFSVGFAIFVLVYAWFGGLRDPESYIPRL